MRDLLINVKKQLGIANGLDINMLHFDTQTNMMYIHTYSKASTGFSGSSYKPTKTKGEKIFTRYLTYNSNNMPLVRASKTPAFSK